MRLKGQQRKRGPLKVRNVTVQCPCGVRFVAPNRLHRKCADCKLRRYKAKLERNRAEASSAPTPRRKPRHIPVEFRPDFLLAFPEMKAELARACIEGIAFKVGARALDDFTLTSLQQPRRRSA
jgi:hypothetical protein